MDQIGHKIYMLLILFLSLPYFLKCLSHTSNEDLYSKLNYIYDNFYDDKYKDGTTGFVIQTLQDSEHIKNLLQYIHNNRKTKLTILNLSKSCNTENIRIEQNILLGNINILFMFIENLKESIKNTISCLQNSSLWKPRSKTVLIINESTNRTSIENIFKLIWSYKILNLIILTIIDNSVQIIGFNPYFHTYFENLTSKDPFYNKLFNLNGYKLNILMTRDEDVTKIIIEKRDNLTKYGGKDGDLVMSILQKNQAECNIVNLHQLLTDKNPWRPFNKGNLEHMKISIIEEYDADFILDSQELAINNVTEFLYPHTRDDVVFLVPKAKFRSQYDQLIKICKDGFIGILIFFIIIIPIIWFIFKYIHTKILKYKIDYLKNFIRIIIINTRILLGGSESNLPKNMFENIFVLFLLFCYVIINSYFQSILASILTVSTYEYQINTIDDVANSNLKPVGVPGVLKDVKEVLKVIGQDKLIPKLGLFPPDQYYLHYRDFPGNACGFGNYDRLSMATIIRPVLHVVNEYVVPTYLSFQIVKGSPYYDLFDRYILRILEAGLYDMWKRSNLYKLVLKIGIHDKDLEIREYKDLTMRQFRGVFLLLYIGLGISLLVFIIEVWFHRVKKYRIFNT